MFQFRRIEQPTIQSNEIGCVPDQVSNQLRRIGVVIHERSFQGGAANLNPHLGLIAKLETEEQANMVVLDVAHKFISA